MSNAPRDNNYVTTLIVVDADDIANETPVFVTGRELTNSQPLDVAIVDASGNHTSGMSIFRSIDIDESEEQVKATAGIVYSISAFNTTDAPIYLKFYNDTAANVTVGTTTPVLTLVVPGNADSDGAGFVWNSDTGYNFDTAVTVAATTGVADNDTTGPGANACIVNIGYV